MLFEVVIDIAHRFHPRIFLHHVRLQRFARLIPVINTPNERGDEINPGLGAGPGLGEGKQQRQVAVDPLFLQHLRGADPLPGGCQLDQDPRLINAHLLIQRHQMASLLDTFLAVEGEPGVHLGGDPSGNAFEDLRAKIDRQLIAGVSHLRFAAATLFFGPGDSVVDEAAIGRQAGGLQQQRGVGGGVFRMVVADGFDVSAVGDHRGELLDAV